MALHLGSSNVKLNIGGIARKLSIYTPSETPILNGTMLLSSEGYILKDSQGLYLTTKEDE